MDEVAARKHTRYIITSTLVHLSSMISLLFTAYIISIIIIIIITRYDSDENSHGPFPCFSGITSQALISSHASMDFGGKAKIKGRIHRGNSEPARKDSEEKNLHSLRRRWKEGKEKIVFTFGIVVKSAACRFWA